MTDILEQIHTPELREYSEKLLRVALLQEEKNNIEQCKIEQEEHRLQQEGTRLRVDEERNDLVSALMEEIRQLARLAKGMVDNHHSPVMAALQDVQYHILLILKVLDIMLPSLVESQSGSKQGQAFHAMIQKALESNRLLLHVSGSHQDTPVTAGGDVTLDGATIGDGNQVVSKSSSGGVMTQGSDSDVAITDM